MKKLSHLPVELWVQILCFLPVESLLLLRSVCKLFLSIIDDPKFVPLHLRSFPGNLHETQTLVQTYDAPSKIRFEIRDANSFGLTGKLDPGLKIGDFRITTGSLDGLLLLKASDGDEAAMLWNPSTRKSRRLQLPIPLPRAAHFRIEGLAYDSDSADYKVIYIAYNYLFNTFLDRTDLDQFRPLGVWVYGVKTSSWSTVDMERSGMCSTPRALSKHPWSLFFNGGLLWIEGWYSSKKDEYSFEKDEYRLRMVRFNPGTHKFSYYAHLPPSPPEKHIQMETRLVTLDGGTSLGFCGLDDCDRVSLWACLDDSSSSSSSSSSWVIRCVVHQYPVQDLDFGTFARVSENEELTWKYHTSGGAISVFTYNIRTHHCHHSQIGHRRALFQGEHFAYVQSLIML